MQGTRCLVKNDIYFLCAAAAADVCRKKPVLKYFKLHRAFLNGVSYSRDTIKLKKALIALSQIHHRKD
jgi:hypothetical protein